ncbi:MAG TPA: helix-turn-helix transcriptional regulator [Streptosporangiales bacterium]
MPRSARAARAERDVVRLCHNGLTGDALRGDVLRALRRLLPVDAAFLATADPDTLLFTGAWPEEPLGAVTRLFLENEFGARDVNRFATLATSARHVATLDGATRRDRAASERYREIMRPLGLGDELRAALVAGADCWGYLCLHREDGELGFTAAEAATLGRIAPHLAQALRMSVLLHGTAADDVAGPGVVLLDDELETVATTPDADRLLSPAEGVSGRLPLPVYAVARALQAIEGGTASSSVLPRARVRTSSGTWISLAAARLNGAAGEGRLAVVVEPVEPRAAAPLLLSAHGLSPRETEVVRLVLRGLPTRSIAAELHISGHTVQDHLKAVFDKVGVRSRPELVGLLLSPPGG